MITKFSKWIIYLSSYLQIYFIYLINLIISLVNCKENHMFYIVTIIIISLVFIISTATIAMIGKASPNH